MINSEEYCKPYLGFTFLDVLCVSDSVTLLFIDGLVGGLALLLGHHGALVVIDCVVDCLTLNKVDVLKKISSNNLPP